MRGTISRITGKDDETVRRYFLTFKTLAGLANFDAKPSKGSLGSARPGGSESQREQPKPKEALPSENAKTPIARHESPDFHYNIQIHLPVTTDISVYNAIFKSLREHLAIG